MIRPLLITGLGCLAALPAWAQQNLKQAEIARAEVPPTIDGELGDTEWSAATIISDLHQVQPDEYAAPSQRTEWYVMYDAETLYVAARAYDDQPDAIAALQLRQGAELDDDDRLRVIVDAFNNKRSGYSFALNPYGVREDGIYTNGTRLSEDWEGIWRGAASIDAEGWVMEMAIPFNTLTFDPNNDTWGLNLARDIRRASESIAWSSVNGEINPTVSGELVGIRNINQGRGLDVIPSVSATRDKNFIDNTTDNDFKPSLDINYKLTPSLNGTLTINTDFAATEVDDRQVDLSRFSLFFPEKRSFFLTDFDIFQFGGITGGGGGGDNLIGNASGPNALPFFSRRIGLSEDRTPVDLIGGLKISGRVGNTDIGALYVRQDEFESVDATDVYVARVVQGVLEESSVGAIFTSGDPATNDSSTTAGVDFIYRNTRLPGNRTMEAQFWAQSSDTDGLSGDNGAYNFSIGFPAREGLGGGFQYHVVEENFSPALGFANRTNVELFATEIDYRWVNSDSKWFQRIRPSIEFERWNFVDSGELQSQKIEIQPIRVGTSSGGFYRIFYQAFKERLLPGEQPLDSIGITLPAGEYSFDRVGAFFLTPQYRELWVGFRIDDGDFFSGKRRYYRSFVGWTPNEHVAFLFEGDYFDFRFPGQRVITRQYSLENTVAFDSQWSLITLAQYDNVSDDLGINIRLRYNRAAGQDFWFVINHNMTEEMPGEDFRSVETQATAKIRYTFRF
ncbi:MAG: sugar-binding protein [Pseudomonadota bacterium]